MRFIFLILVLVISVSCTRKSTLGDPKPLVKTNKLDNFQFLNFENLKPQEIGMLVERMYQGNEDFFIDAVNNRGIMSLFMQNGDKFQELDLSFLRSYNIFITDKLIYDDGHYLVFYNISPENNEGQRRDGSGLAIIKDGQVVYNETTPRSYTNTWQIEKKDGYVTFLKREYDEEENITYTIVFYDGFNIQEVEAPANLNDLTQSFYWNDNIYFMAIDDNDDQTYLYELNSQTKTISKYNENVLDKTKWPDFYEISYYNGNMYFIGYVPSNDSNNRAVIELSSNGLRVVTDDLFNWINNFAIDENGMLHVYGSNNGISVYDIEGIIDSYNISIPSGSMDRLFELEGVVAFLTYEYDPYGSQYKLHAVVEDESIVVADFENSYPRQLMIRNEELLILVYNYNENSTILKLDPLTFELSEKFEFNKDDGFARNMAYSSGETIIFGKNLCFTSWTNQENQMMSGYDKMYCYNGEELKEIYSFEREPMMQSEYIQYSRLISNGKMIFMTNMNRLFIVNESLEIEIKTSNNLDEVGTPLLVMDNGDIIFSSRYNGNQLKVYKNDETISDYSSTVFDANTINQRRSTGKYLTIRAEEIPSGDIKVYKVSTDGSTILLEGLDYASLDDSRNSQNFVSHDGKIINLDTNTIYEINGSDYFDDLVVKGDKFWFIASIDPYEQDYIFEGTLSTGEINPIAENSNFSTSRLYYGGRPLSGSESQEEEIGTNVRLDASDLVYYNNHIYWIGNNENNYRIIFRMNTETKEVEEFFHPELNPRNYLARSLRIIGNKLYFKALSPDVDLGEIYGEIILDEEKHNDFDTYKEDEMQNENYKGSGYGFGPS